MSSDARIYSCRYRNASSANGRSASASSWRQPANSPSSRAGTQSPPAGFAERIEYSQPVLYSHFRGKREIVGAVALQGAAELATAVRAATSAADRPRARAAALARAYLDFAARNPAVYDALFQLDGGLAYAQEDTPSL